MVDHLKMLLVHGWSLPYASLSLFSPQAGPSTTVQGSRKQSTSTFTGGSGTQAGSSTPFTLQGSTAYGGSSPPQDGGSFQSQSLSTKYTPESQHSPYCTSVAGQGTLSASASEVLSSYSSMNNQNAPAQPSRRSSSSRFYGQGLKDFGKLMQISSRIETPINVLSKAILLMSLLKDGGIPASLVTVKVVRFKVFYEL